MLALGNGADCAFECMYYMQHKRQNQNIRYQPLTLKIRFLVAEKKSLSYNSVPLSCMQSSFLWRLFCEFIMYTWGRTPLNYVIVIART